MAIIYITTDAEEERCNKLGANYIRIKTMTVEDFNKLKNDFAISIFMPFLKDVEAYEEFLRQKTMREIWLGN